MTILTPLGLLALLSIVALIIIYIIRPNYQQKFVSTTFVWKLSLRYKKKKIPISKLRNILLIICQILILLLSTAILTTPSKILKAQSDKPEVVLIIDASASMMTTSDGTSRFDRAIDAAWKIAGDTFDNDGTVSLIAADNEPTFVVSGARKERRAAVKESMDALTCTYQVSDIPKAVELCEDVCADNPAAQVYVFTDYLYPSEATNGITVVNVAASNEWNAAILSVEAEKNNGCFMFVATICVYGRNTGLTLNINAKNINGRRGNNDASSPKMQVEVDCLDGQPMTVVFLSGDRHGAENDAYSALPDTFTYDFDTIYTYESVLLYLDVDDDLPDDDVFSLFGGEREPINVLYYSTSPNRFFSAILGNLSSYYAKSNTWEFYPFEKTGEDMPTDGYNFYIYEHRMPSTLPTDGLVFLVDPDDAPAGVGFDIRGYQSFNKNVDYYLSATNPEHPMMKGIRADDITVSTFSVIRFKDDEEYDVLMDCNEYPVLFCKKEGATQIVVMAFSIHYSNITITDSFVRLMVNIMDYYIPKTVESNYYEAGSTVTFNSRGYSLEVRGTDADDVTVFESFPATKTFTVPGVYTLTQQTYFQAGNEETVESIFVKAPAAESNIFDTATTLVNRFGKVDLSDFYRDLLFYFALALVALLFAEWALQARDNM